MKNLFILSLYLFTATALSAQYYDTGEDPSWIKWRQIQTKHFKLVYPSNLDSTAQRYARLFDAMADSVGAPLKTRLPRIPVVLHAYNVLSNGVVAWAPSRMELHTTPAVDGYPQPWDRQLVLHETRHVAQMNKLGTNTMKILYGLIGEQATGLAAGLFVPKWFLEGDAVVSETALSGAGRGRQSGFLMAQKAILLHGMSFKWDTWKNGSYRYPMPDVYELGYRLVSQAYLSTDGKVFGDMLARITQRPFALPLFDRNLKKYTGYTSKQLEKYSSEELKKTYLREDSLRTPDVPYQPVSSGNDDYRSFRYPVILPDNRIIALYSDLNRPRQLVEIKTGGKLRKLTYVGHINSPLHHNRGIIYWTEVVPHPRWAQQNYSVIKCYDIHSGKIYTLTRRTRFFGVSIDAGGSLLSTVENTPEGLSRLVVIPLTWQGKLPQLLTSHVRYVDADSYRTWQHTVWFAPDPAVPGASPRLAATLLDNEGLGLYEVDPSSGNKTPLIQNGLQDINGLVSMGDRIVFESGYKGVNNIYAIEPANRNIYRLTNARFGAFDPSFNPAGDTLVYSHYHLYGYETVKIAVDSLFSINSDSQPYRYARADNLSDLAQFKSDTTAISSEFHYESKPYRKITHLFRIHSWAPIYINPDEIGALSLERITEAGLGVTLFSQNTLGTAIGRFGYNYANGHHSGHLAFTYKGWIPIIECNLDFNERKATRTDLFLNEDRELISISTLRSAPYTDLFTRLYIPFNFNRNGWQRALIPQLEGHITNDAYFSGESTPYYYRYLSGGITWYSRLSTSLRELYPRWGYMTKILYLGTLSSGINFGDIIAMQLTTYSPGLFPNHSLQLKAGYQQQRLDGKLYYLPISLLSPARGYFSTVFEKETALSVDYSFPLFYPDWNVGRVFYFKRLQANLFSDYAYFSNHWGKQRNLSAGFDLSTDFHFFRFAFPMNMGIRYAFPFTSGYSPVVSFLFNIRLDS